MGPKKMLSCEICEKAFNYKSDLTRHLHVHSGEKPFPCPECGRYFARKWYLHNHILTHTGKKPFKCQDCNTSFTRKGDLKSHIFSHSGIKPFQCKECDKSYARKWYLKRHIVSMHSVKELFHCEECGELFTTEDGLERHSNGMHTEGELFECHGCGKQFSRKDSLRKHVLVQCGLRDSSGATGPFPVKLERSNSAEHESILPDLHDRIDISSLGENTMNQDLYRSAFSPVETDEHKIGLTDEETSLSLEMYGKTGGSGPAKKLRVKESFMMDQLKKIAAIYKQLHPEYTSVESPCKLDKSLQISLRNEYNFWTFTCRQIPADDTAKIAGATWEMKPGDVPARNDDTGKQYPAFITRTIKVFDDFLKHLATKTNNPRNRMEYLQGKESFNIELLANSKEEVMAIVATPLDSPFIKRGLEDYLEIKSADLCNVKSLYYRAGKSTAEYLYGCKKLSENVGSVRALLDEKFVINPRSVEILSKAIENYLKPSLQSTLFEIGCGNGLIGLLLSPKCKEVIGLDNFQEIPFAEKLLTLNNTENVRFVVEGFRRVEMVFDELKQHKEVIGIVNHNSDCGLSRLMMDQLRSVQSLHRLVVVTPLSEECFPSLAKLMKPVNDELNNCFVPSRACIVDTMPGSHHFHRVILMKRKEIVPVKIEIMT